MLSFTAEASRIIGLVGPSGCGKTTVLDLIGGLRRPQNGRIVWTGSGSTSGPGEPRTSWVIQSNPVLVGRSALDNAAVALLAQGNSMRQARAEARTVLTALGLASRADAPIGELSGGETQRVTIARSLLASAPILIADEPTGQLDAASSNLVYEALRAAADANKLVFVATHDPWLADRCDQQITLRSGGDYAVGRAR
ncbi:ATP-binding cassette domain-containing protein [Microbacterium sp. NPDC089320]|uniref:ATP-binding cassette domain-containing protein n=1 Tax=Microbacterium sp. NPDC089320 TaxID=3155182 RepID=UPI00344182C3